MTAKRNPKSLGGVLSTFVVTTNLLCDAALALFYPQTCTVCGAGVESRFDGVACDLCWRDTRLFSGADTLCWKCGVLVPAVIEDDRRAEVRCHRCEDASFTVARACGLYEGALRASIIALKRKPHVCRKLTLLMLEQLRRAPLNQATCILPVPLHPERQKQRGFNQAALLAEGLANLAQIPFADQVLARTEHTERHRAGMDAQSRRESVEEAFVVLHPRLVEGENILLIDDVFTTGATASACAAALRKAGAKEILVLTLARPLHS